MGHLARPCKVASIVARELETCTDLGVAARYSHYYSSQARLVCGEGGHTPVEQDDGTLRCDRCRMRFELEPDA
jgi:hypothetical protein